MISRALAAIRQVYDCTHWFSDKEAWAIFRLFATLEAVGWTLLIGAIVYRAFDLPGFDIAIGLAGRVHGIFFLLYFLFTLLTARSMGWNIWTLLAALAAGMPPYTSLVFERIMSYMRRKRTHEVALPAGYDD